MKKQRQIIPPPKGPWRQNHVYLVNVTMRKGNPPWRAVLLTGFKEEKSEHGALFGAYSKLVANGCDSFNTGDAMSIEFVKDLGPINYHAEVFSKLNS